MAAELHASFDPQASVLPHPLIAGEDWVFAGGGAGWERLKTEECCTIGEVTVGFVGGGAEEAEKSKRSLNPELEFVAAAVGVTPGAESNAPNPLDELNPRVG